MTNEAEDRVSKFYNTVGWETKKRKSRKTPDDGKIYRENAREYVSKCRLRVLRHIPENGENMLDMASGPIQYIEYLEYSRNFKKRYCVDLSSGALESAKNKIGDHGVFLPGSFFDIPLEDNLFDCSISLHTIYHIDKDRQEEAVRKLIRVTKPGQPIIIVYSNPNTILYSLAAPVRLLKKAKQFIIKPKQTTGKKESSAAYSYRHPNEWWNRFDDSATIKIYPVAFF